MEISNLLTVMSPLQRSRLKGCEAEVARLLDTKWKHITHDWEIDMDMNDIPMDDRRGM
jgi:hypothetical protein